MMRLSVCARIARILFSIADCTILKVAKSRNPPCFSTVFILARLMRACAKVARQEPPLLFHGFYSSKEMFPAPDAFAAKLFLFYISRIVTMKATLLSSSTYPS